MNNQHGGTVRVGTRGSPLALAQANDVIARLIAAGSVAPGGAEVSVISVVGDRIQDRPLAEVGGKGLFTKEIEQALLDGTIHMAVHSMKDVPTQLPDGLEIACLLPREDPRDVLFGAKSIGDLGAGAVVGTSSLRRGAQIKHLRPDVAVASLRGNVQTRLKKLQAGEADATLLALAGLRRLGLADTLINDGSASILEPSEMLPAVAQGAVGIEIRSDDTFVRELVAPLNDDQTRVAVSAERALLASLDGSCRTPIAALAIPDGDGLWLRAAVLFPDGRQRFDTERRGSVGDALALGSDAGSELRKTAGPELFESWQS
ncbi:MAG: hydroxymethylbilane synthase [Alphaproteobacteria bacterium]|nr:hydroxymethylbilane synthase [Alphaproteobacteria bacterium]MBT4710405.1 hydroxymethylbilane synthase [Alphaproteobacteria bacterium]MBT5860023.1 hydroxymethylbilane synthase [Alphaproteobacteria bacterium]